MTKKNTAAKPTFRSDRFIFRPTTLADALMRAGIDAKPRFIRELKSEVTK